MGGLAFAISKWTTGIYFDILHCLGNFVIAWVLFKPLRTLLERLYVGIKR